MKRYEIEKKYRLKNPSAMRRLLRRLKSRKIGTGREQNIFFDFRGALRKKRITLRLRSHQGCGLLTLKGPRQTLVRTRASRRLELETPADFKTTRALLLAAGFKIFLQYAKRREVFHLSGAEVVLDFLPRKGWFLEIEAPVRTIARLEKKLGLTANDAEPRSYLQMLKRK